MKRSTASGKTSVDVLKLRLPTEAPSNYNDGVFCLKLSPQWFGIILALTDNLLIRGVWENKTDDQWSQIRRWVEEVGSLVTDCDGDQCPECPECPECPPPPPPPAIRVGGGTEAVGILGLTIGELEEIIMGFSLRSQLKYVNGVLCYWSEGCCDWVPVENDGTAPAPLTPAGIAALGSGTLTLDDWIAAGRPTMPTYPAAPHSNPAYTTPASVTCAKATALAEQMRENYGSLFSAFSAVAAGSASSVGIAGGVVASALGVGTLIAFAIAIVLAGAVLAYNYTTVVEALDDIHDNDAAWQTMICSMIPEMTEGSVIQAVDVEVLYYWLRDAHNIGVDDWQYQLMRSLPISYWQDKVQPKLVDTECRCDEYLPYGYNANPIAGFHFTHMKFGAMPTSLNSFLDLHGKPLGEESVSNVLNVGTLSGNKAKTVYGGLQAGYPFTRFHWILELSEPATLSSVELDLGYQGSNIHQISMECQVYRTDTSLWTNFSTAGDSAAPFETAFLMFSGENIPTVKYISIELYVQATQSSNSPVYATVADVRVNGLLNGVPFTDLQIDTAVS